jgi:hypothetical protein
MLSHSCRIWARCFHLLAQRYLSSCGFNFQAFTGVSSFVQNGEWDTKGDGGRNEQSDGNCDGGQGVDDWNTAPEIQRHEYRQPEVEPLSDSWNTANDVKAADGWNSVKDDAKAADWDSEWSSQPNNSAPKETPEKKEDSWDSW